MLHIKRLTAWEFVVFNGEVPVKSFKTQKEADAFMNATSATPAEIRKATRLPWREPDDIPVEFGGPVSMRP